MASGGIFQGDKTFLALLGGVVLVGFVVLASASGPTGFVKFDDAYYFLKHQLIFGLLPGAIGFLVASRVPYAIFRKFAGVMLLVSIVLLLSVFIPGLGTDLGTFAKQWIKLGTFTMQPSEIVKLTFLSDTKNRNRLSVTAFGFFHFKMGHYFFRELSKVRS
jgi:cell division protein FtsW